MGPELISWPRLEARCLASPGRLMAASSDLTRMTRFGKCRPTGRILTRYFPAVRYGFRIAAAGGLRTESSSCSGRNIRENSIEAKYGPSTSGARCFGLQRSPFNWLEDPLYGAGQS